MTKKLIPQELPHMDIITQYALSKVNMNTSTAKKNAEARRSIVRGFLKFAGKPIEEIAPEDIEAYRSHLEAIGYASSTIYQKISILSQFFQYAITKGLILYSPIPSGGWRNSFRPRPYSSEKTKALSPQEVKMFLEAIDRETVAGSRLYAMTLTMLMTGMRVSEVCGILWKNVNLDNGTPTVRTKIKGGEFVTFELTEEATKATKEYLRVSGRDPNGEEPLFLNGDGSITPHRLWRQVKKVGKVIKLPWISPHTFRHTHAETLNKIGWSIPEIQGSLGHRSGKTTQVYLHSLAPRSNRAGQAIQDALRGE